MNASGTNPPEDDDDDERTVFRPPTPPGQTRPPEDDDVPEAHQRSCSCSGIRAKIDWAPLCVNAQAKLPKEGLALLHLVLSPSDT